MAVKLGERLRGAARRARARLAKARKNPNTSKARRRQARRTAMFWNDRLREFRRKLKEEKLTANLWGGSRAVTNEVVRLVAGRAPITSRKRWATFGNPGSDHYMGNRTADAVDFGIGEAHWLKNEISRKLGGPSTLADYGSFVITRNAKRFRVQIIASTHGTGPHLHVGVRRA